MNDIFPTKTPGLYIHVPFCRSKCGYCDFYSETSLELKPLFLRSLPEEMHLYRDVFGTFDSLYFGGGTPSVLSPGEIEDVMHAVHSNFSLTGTAEITLEANPADLDAGYLIKMHSLGFNRLNIGVQSFDDSVLAFLGRRHTAEEAKSAVCLARAAGFDNIGLDLIYGIPGQSLNLWLETLRMALAFEPEHLSCYQLTLSPAAPLGIDLREKRFSLPEEDLSLRFFFETAGILGSAGYIHYEVSNYARAESLISRHNGKYWDHSPYLGLGPGAHSFQINRRWWNFRSVKSYAELIASKCAPVEGRESLSRDDLILEALFLGMRKPSGFCLDEFQADYGVDLEKEKHHVIESMEAEGLVSFSGGYLRPTLQGLAVADSLALI